MTTTPTPTPAPTPVSQAQFDQDFNAFNQALQNGLSSLQSNYSALLAKLAAVAPTVDLTSEDQAVQADLTALNNALAAMPAPAAAAASS